MIRSHPDLYLSEHVAQIRQAMNSILAWHSNEVATTQIRQLCDRLAMIHDLGKGSAAFQEYIANPVAYIGDPLDKTHTPLSAMLTLLLAMDEKWDALETLMLAAAVFGHHRGLPTVEKLREIGSGFMAQIIKRQVKTINWKAGENGTSLRLPEVGLIDRPWAVAQRYLDTFILPIFERLSIDQAIDLRLKTQLIFSVLLEADKAFLAVANPTIYLKKEQRQWQSNWVDIRLQGLNDDGVNAVRKKARADVLKNLESDHDNRIFNLTAPTGIGKTLLAATWALSKREEIFAQLGNYPRIIVVLPFLSIIDQTAQEYEALLKIGDQAVDGTWFLTSHSLSERQYAENMEVEAERFFIDTWRTELVITTYDQFLLSLFDPKAKYQMRFHNLCDALIVFDEVQSLPCKLWKPLEAVLKSLVSIGNSRILLMSATLPPFISNTEPLLKKHAEYFACCKRYKMFFRLKEAINIDQFCEEVVGRLPVWLREQKRVLITLNTRQSARLISDALEVGWPDDIHNIPLIFITADVTPNDRLLAISVIKKGEPCIVVSTQCIEAGVDIDMDLVIRDFGPLDSLVQIAGRCNREWRNPEPAKVEIVDIVNKQKRRYSEMVYDDVHLAVTRQVLNNHAVVNEKAILQLADEYFRRLSNVKDKGELHLERFARWEDDVSVKELLRGKNREEYTFLVSEQDPDLKAAMATAQKIGNRWERREAWRKLAARIARVSVTVYANRGFEPSDIAIQYLGHWILRDGFYKTGKGLVIDNKATQAIQYIF